MSQWPPPPDLDSIQELVRAADPEGHLAEGAPADEYEPEEEQIFAFIEHLPTANLTAPHILPILETVWRGAFSLDDADFAQRRPHSPASPTRSPASSVRKHSLRCDSRDVRS